MATKNVAVKSQITLISKADYDIPLQYGDTHVVIPPRGILKDLDSDKLDLSILESLSVQIRRG